MSEFAATESAPVKEADGGGSSGSLRAKAARASVWRLSVYTITRAVTIITAPILAAVLSPEDFALIAMATVVVQGLAMFSEIGIGPAIIQSKRDDAAFLNTAWTMQAMRGVVLMLGTAVLAWPTAWFYKQDKLGPVVVAVGMSALLAGFNSTSIFTLNRNLAEGRRATVELIGGLLTRGVTIAWAFLAPNVWAFVAGTLVSTLFTLVASHLWLPGIRNRFAFDREAARSLFKFGKWIFVGTVIAFFSQQIDRLMLAKLTVFSAVGVYGIALTVARLPQEFSGVLVAHVVYPVMAKFARDDSGGLGERVLRLRGLLLPVEVAGMLGVVTLSPWFFRVFFDTRYADAEWIAPLAAGAIWVAILSGTLHKTLLALGGTRILAISEFVDVVATVVFCLLGHAIAGLPGFIIGTALGAAASYGVILASLIKRGVHAHWQDLSYTAWFAALSAAGMSVNALADQHLHGFAAPLAGAGVCGMMVAAVGLWGARKLWPEFKKR